MVLPVPTPFGNNSPAPAPMDFMALMGGLNQLTAPPMQPKYPRGFIVPPKLQLGQVTAMSAKAMQANEPWLDQMANIYRWLRMAQQGVFEVDRFRREMDQQEAYISSRLVDMWNAISAYLSDQDIAYTKKARDPNKVQYAQMVEDFAYYLRGEEEYRHAERMNMNLNVEEAKYLTATGMLVSRIVLNMDDSDYPFDVQLVDPCSVFFGGTGISGPKSAFVTTRMNIHQAIADYTPDGEMPKKVKEELKPLLSEFGENAEVEVIEFWDEWRRSVIINGKTELMPMTEHRYGCVPFVVQYGPGGEPMGSRSPDQTQYRYTDDPFSTGHGIERERLHKATSFIHYMIPAHVFREATGAKLLENFLKSLNAPVIIKKTMMAEDGDEPVQVERDAGGETVLGAGDEEITQFPGVDPSAANVSATLMQMFNEDSTGQDMMRALMGTMPGSNISGVAQSMSAESGQSMIAGWRQAAESYHARKFAKQAYLWRNFGHKARFEGGAKKPFFVPNRYPSDGDPVSFEITPEILDEVGGRIECHMWKFKPQEAMQLGQVAQAYMQGGIWNERIFAEHAHQYDYDRVKPQIRADKQMNDAMELPEFKKVFSIPMAIKTAIAQAEGNPQLQNELAEMYGIWMQMVAQPQQQQIQAQSQPQPGMGGPGNVPPPPGAGPGSNTVSRPMVGNQVPGSVTGQQGGPQGPTGPRTPPPPGSFRLA